MPKKQFVLIATTLGTFMATLDSSIINISLPAITSHFSANISQTKWVVLIYFLVITAILIPLGKFSDLRGRKKVFTLGYLIFTLSSLSCGLSSSLEFLIVSRAVQGLGAAMLMGNSPALIAAVFPTGQRGAALGKLAMVVSAGLITGPSLGGLLLHVYGWRSIFLVNIPIGFLGMFLAAYFIEKDCPRIPASKETKSKIAHDVFLLDNSPFWLANISAFLMFVGISSLSVLMPFYLNDVMRVSARQLGLFMTALPLGNLLVAPISGKLSDRLGSRGLCILGSFIGSLSLFLGTGIFGIVDLSHPTGLLVVAVLGGVGLGMGIFQSPNNNVIMGAVAKDKLSISGSLMATTRNLGLVSGAGLGSELFYWKFKISHDLILAFSTALFAAAVFQLVSMAVTLKFRKS